MVPLVGEINELAGPEQTLQWALILRELGVIIHIPVQRGVVWVEDGWAFVWCEKPSLK